MVGGAGGEKETPSKNNNELFELAFSNTPNMNQEAKRQRQLWDINLGI
jgi:hypothetical protein